MSVDSIDTGWYNVYMNKALDGELNMTMTTKESEPRRMVRNARKLLDLGLDRHVVIKLVRRFVEWHGYVKLDGETDNMVKIVKAYMARYGKLPEFSYGIKGVYFKKEEAVNG